MKSVAQLGIIAAVAAAAGFGNWLADGRPSGIPARDFSASEQPLREGEIRLDQIDSLPEEGLLWIDARKREAWRTDGLPGSISITTLSDEPLGIQLERHTEVLFQARTLVIYCDGPECSLSHDLAERLKTDYAGLVPERILVLHGGHVALQAAGRLKDSSPGS